VFDGGEKTFLKEASDKLVKLAKQGKMLPDYETLTEDCNSIVGKLKDLFKFLQERLNVRKEIANGEVRMLPLLHKKNILENGSADENQRKEEKKQEKWILACMYMTAGFLVKYEGDDVSNYDVTNLVAYLRNTNSGQKSFGLDIERVSVLTNTRNGLLHNKAQLLSKTSFETHLLNLVKLVNDVNNSNENVSELLKNGIEKTLQDLRYLREAELVFTLNGSCTTIRQALKDNDQFKKEDDNYKQNKHECEKLDESEQLSMQVYKNNFHKMVEIFDSAKSCLKQNEKIFEEKKKEKEERKVELAKPAAKPVEADTCFLGKDEAQNIKNKLAVMFPVFNIMTSGVVFFADALILVEQ